MTEPRMDPATGLLPCPFCGSENLDDGREPDYDHVLCLDCRASGPGCVNWRIAQDAWNRRAPAVPDPALLALARFGARILQAGLSPAGFAVGLTGSAIGGAGEAARAIVYDLWHGTRLCWWTVGSQAF